MTIGAALAARHHFLWVYCPACRTMRDVDLRALNRHCDAAVTSLIPLSRCESAPKSDPPLDHTALGLQVIIEDYLHSAAKIPALVLVRLGCFALAAAGILAVLRIALGG